MTEDELVAALAQGLARAMLAPAESETRFREAAEVQCYYNDYLRVATDSGLAQLAGRIASLGGPYEEILRDLTMILNLKVTGAISDEGLT